MQICSWPNNVNKKVLAETTIMIGEGGFVEDKNSSGYEDRRLTAFAVPDTFQVTMDFDWAGVDPIHPMVNGLSEYDRFVRWYKFIHQRGAKPFWFPCITKHSINNLTYGENSDMCLYKITSALQPSVSGYSQRVKMTWKEVYAGTVSITSVTSNLDHIVPYADHVVCIFNSEPSEEPLFNNFSIKYRLNGATDWVENYHINRMSGNGRAFNLYYAKIPKGKYQMQVTYDGITSPLETFEVTK